VLNFEDEMQDSVNLNQCCKTDFALHKLSHQPFWITDFSRQGSSMLTDAAFFLNTVRTKSNTAMPRKTTNNPCTFILVKAQNFKLKFRRFYIFEKA
jgi:hypothetical protein